MTPFVST